MANKDDTHNDNDTHTPAPQTTAAPQTTDKTHRFVRISVEETEQRLKEVFGDKVQSVSARTLRRWKVKIGVKTAYTKTETAKNTIKNRKTAKREAALLVYSMQIDVEEAAERAKCSTRTIYRYLSRLRTLLGETDVQ